MSDDAVGMLDRVLWELDVIADLLRDAGFARLADQAILLQRMVHVERNTVIGAHETLSEPDGLDEIIGSEVRRKKFSS